VRSSLVRNEPGQVALYLVLKFVLGSACSLVFYIGFVFFLLFALIPFGIVAGVDWFSLHNTPLWGHVVMIGLWVVLGVLYVALLFGGAIMGTGYIATFMQAYALYFLGGRYPMVGQYLAPYWPPEYNYAPPPAYYPPPPPSVVEPTPDAGTNLLAGFAGSETHLNNTVTRFLFLAFTLNQIGEPMNLKVSRISLARNRS
jgi:hypothetical protein